MVKILFNISLMIPLSLQAQVMGHPGGGVEIFTYGSTSAMNMDDWQCLHKASKAISDENEFLKSWDKKYTSINDTFNLFEYIQLGVTTKYIELFFPTQPLPSTNCVEVDGNNIFDL